MFKRILSFFLSALFFTTLVACDQKDEGKSSSEQIKEQSSSEQITIDDSFLIIYAENADAPTTKAAAKLRSALASRGLRVFQRLDTTPETDHEILIGATNRNTTESTKASISVSGSKILITAPDSISLYLFIEHLCEAWVKEAAEPLTLTKSDCADLKKGWELPTTFSLLSQNLRCANDPNGNSIAERRVRFRELMKEITPDLIGTQEVTKEWLNALKSDFGADYNILGSSRDGKSATSGEWCAILVKKSRYEILSSDTFWLSDTPDKASMTENALYRRIATWAKLKDKLTGKELVFVNTHLDNSNNTVREAQAKILMKELSPIIGDLPVVLTGDFNATPTSSPISYLKSVLAEAGENAISNSSTINYTYHDYGAKQTMIDFCFYSKKSLTAVENKIHSQNYGGYVSDHYGVLSTYYYND